jgi:hypothetical protein
MSKPAGKTTIPSYVNVWPHELRTAQSLTAIGHNVEFIRKSELDRQRSADAYVDGVRYEFKAPKSDKMDAVERNLKKASRQSCNVVFDSRRMKKIPDVAILRELTSKSHANKSIKRLLFVNRCGIVVVVK